MYYSSILCKNLNLSYKSKNHCTRKKRKNINADHATGLNIKLKQLQISNITA